MMAKSSNKGKANKYAKKLDGILFNSLLLLTMLELCIKNSTLMAEKKSSEERKKSRRLLLGHKSMSKLIYMLERVNKLPFRHIFPVGSETISPV